MLCIFITPFFMDLDIFLVYKGVLDSHSLKCPFFCNEPLCTQVSFTTVILWCLKLADCVGIHSYAVTGVRLVSIEVKCLHSSEDLCPRHVENPLQ